MILIFIFICLTNFLNFIFGCSTEDGNVIHKFANVLGEEKFDFFTEFLDRTTELGVIIGEASQSPTIMIASGVANLGMNWCFKNYEDDKTRSIVENMNFQLNQLEDRLINRSNALQISMHKIDLKNSIIYPSKNGLDRILTFQKEQSPSSLKQLKLFCENQPPHEILKNLANKLRDDRIGQQIITHSDYNAEIYNPYRNEIDETIKALLVLIGYCETVLDRYNISQNHHLKIAKQSLKKLNDQLLSDDNILHYGFWPNSINSTVVAILKNGKQNSNSHVQHQISAVLRKKYSWTNFTVIVYDAVVGYDNHLLVDAAVHKYTLHYFRFAGKNTIVFKSPFDKDMIHNLYEENELTNSQIFCKRANTLFDIYSVYLII